MRTCSKNFNKRQKKILLRIIIDDNDLLSSQRASDNFVAGVRYGVKFMIEMFGGAECGP